MSDLILGKYRVVQRLAVGGMGEIFQATQRVGNPGFERPVVLKTLLPDLAADPVFVAQFFDEARVAASLDHPNVVNIYEAGEWNGSAFIAMEFIKGCTVSQLIKASVKEQLPVPPLVVAKIICDAALGLAHAHAARDARERLLGIVHRDVSPQNIMVRHDGVSKVVDFGIARAANRTQRTATGAVKGKIAYMAPEQIALEPVTPAVDQFALGCVLWELCTGRHLFDADGEAQLVVEVSRCDVPRPTTIASHVPHELEDIVMRMLSRCPAERYPGLAQVARQLQIFMGKLGASPPEDSVARYLRQLGLADASLRPSPTLHGLDTLPTTESRPTQFLAQARNRVAVIAATAMVVVVGGILVATRHPSPGPASGPAPVPAVSASVPVDPPVSLALPPIAVAVPATPAPRDAETAMVTVSCGGAQGAGFFVGPTRVLTREQFACLTPHVRLADGRTLLGAVASRSVELDLAELELAGGEGDPLPLGASTTLKPGDAVTVPGAGVGTVNGITSRLGVPQLLLTLGAAAAPGSPVLNRVGEVVGVMTDATHALPIEAHGPAARWTSMKARSEPAVGAEIESLRKSLEQPGLVAALTDPAGARYAVLLSLSQPPGVELELGTCNAPVDVAWEPFRSDAFVDTETRALFHFIDERGPSGLSMGIAKLPPLPCHEKELVMPSADPSLRTAILKPIAMAPRLATPEP